MSTTVVDKVKAAFEVAFGFDGEKFSVDLLPEDIQGWDSLGHLSLVTALQDQFGVEFEVNEVMDMDSVKKIVAICETKTPAS